METSNFFEHQPKDCRLPLPPKELVGVEDYLQRVMFVDPEPFYERVAHLMNPFNRYNWTIQFAQLFPKREDGTCACGCGVVLPVGRPMWATKDCQMYAVCVWNVLGGRQDFIGMLLEKYTGSDLCMKCGERAWKDVDHIYPVSKGGGSSWLCNYQNLCKKCHKEKTRSDFGWQKLKTTKDE